MRDEPIDDDETTGELRGPERRTDPAPDDGDAVTMYPCPPLFLKEEETTDERPLTAEIKTVIVHRRRGIKDLPYLGWKTIEELWEAEDVLREYGEGTYILYGRGLDRRNNIRVVTLTVGDPDARKAIVSPRPAPRSEVDFAKVVGAVATAAAPFLALWQEAARERREEARRDREREDERRREERERDQQRHNEQMDFIAKLAAARNDDLVALLKTQAETKSSGGTAESYREGQADAIAMLAELREGGLGKEDPENKLIDLLGSLVAGGRMGKEQAEAFKKAVAEANGSPGGGG